MSVGHLVAEPGRNWDTLQFRLIFATVFVFHFAAAAIARLTPGHWRAGPHRSIFAEACEGAGTTAQMAFAG